MNAPILPRAPRAARFRSIERQWATNRVRRAALLHARFEGRDLAWRTEVILRAAISRAIDAGVSDFDLDLALAEGRRGSA